MKLMTVVATMATVLNLGACASVVPAIAPPPKAETPISDPVSARAANPASMNCIQYNGKLQIERDAQGKEVTYCLLPSGKRCEEWDMFRGNCPTRTVNPGMKFGF